jgi:hypothetical protein
MLRPTTGSYHLRYTALLPQHRAYRCPLWLPTIPADGQSRAIAIHVELPAGAVPGADSMPAMTWSERRGEATLGHLPVFLYVPFTAEGVTAPWSVSRTVDAFTIAIIVFASAVWMWMRKRGHHASRKAS